MGAGPVREVVRAEGVASAILSGRMPRMWCTKTPLLAARSLYFDENESQLC
jgi:hypothetical protein